MIYISENLFSESSDLRYNIEKNKPLLSFLHQYNIDPEKLYYMGSGDFGTAYSTGDGRILKQTRSKTEFQLAHQILKADYSFPNFAKIYAAEEINEDYYILMEELDIDGEIEDLYQQVMDMLETQNLPEAYMGNFDMEEYEETYGEPEDDVRDFFDQLYDVVKDYRYLGLTAPDIRPENLGYASDGTLKAFDIDDRSMQ